MQHLIQLLQPILHYQRCDGMQLVLLFTHIADSLQPCDGASAATGAKSASGGRIAQLRHWCGPDFEGLLLFDECHRAKNASIDKEGEWTKTSSQVAIKVIELQAALPRAGVVYCRCAVTTCNEDSSTGWPSAV